MDPYQPTQPIFESDESASSSFTVLRNISGILNNCSAPDFGNLTFSTNHPPQTQQYHTSHTQHFLNTPTNSFLTHNHRNNADISIPSPAMSPSMSTTPLQSSTPLPYPSTPIQDRVRMVPDIYNLADETVVLKRRKATTHQQPIAPAGEHGGKQKRGQDASPILHNLGHVQSPATTTLMVSSAK